MAGQAEPLGKGMIETRGAQLSKPGVGVVDHLRGHSGIRQAGHQPTGEGRRMNDWEYMRHLEDKVRLADEWYIKHLEDTVRLANDLILILIVAIVILGLVLLWRYW